MKPTIIVLQTSYAGFMGSRDVLIEMGLKENKDFLLLNRRPNIEDFVPDTRQVFITGTFYGGHEGVAAMVQKARDRNKDLITVAFSLDLIKGPFDLQVIKGVGAREQLKEIVQNFQNGTLVRTDVSWKAPEPRGILSL